MIVGAFAKIRTTQNALSSIFCVNGLSPSACYAYDASFCIVYNPIHFIPNWRSRRARWSLFRSRSASKKAVPAVPKFFPRPNPAWAFSRFHSVISSSTNRTTRRLCRRRKDLLDWNGTMAVSSWTGHLRHLFLRCFPTLRSRRRRRRRKLAAVAVDEAFFVSTVLCLTRFRARSFLCFFLWSFSPWPIDSALLWDSQSFQLSGKDVAKSPTLVWGKAIVEDASRGPKEDSLLIFSLSWEDSPVLFGADDIIVESPFE